MDMGRGEEKVRYIERVTWKLALPYLKQIANRNLLCGSGNSNSTLFERCGMGKERGRGFRREWICVYLWLIHVEFCN